VKIGFATKSEMFTPTIVNFGTMIPKEFYKINPLQQMARTLEFVLENDCNSAM